ncbi:MAG: hypothetical protein ABJZ55_10725 [Fuerstiella sp.]
MKRLIPVLILIVHCASAMAQRDPPVWNSYLPRIVMFDERDTLDFEVTYNKAGGPHEQTHCQMYVLAYLQADEGSIKKLAADPKLTTKAKGDRKLLLDVLQEKKLAVVLESKVAACAEKRPVVSTRSARSVRSGYCTDFEFSFNNGELFQSISKLRNFDSDSFVASSNRLYNDKFKLMLFVPVNDSKYATKIPQDQQQLYDFAHFVDSETVIQYFKPLPYRYQFVQFKESGDFGIYID